MNLSMQISRAMFAVGLMVAAGACAFAQTDGGTDADAQAPSVAHKRLEIQRASDAKEDARWVVASVRVGKPVGQEPEQAARVAAHERLALVPRS